MKIPEFNTKKELFDFLIENKEKIIASKKNEVKHGDGIAFLNQKNWYNISVKDPSDTTKSEVEVKAIINTTNFMDSHKDVHLPGIWSKSLQENKYIMHLQEHNMAFDKIISDGEDLKAFTKSYKWSELGYDYKGTTEALVFDSTIKRDRNPFMLKQYQDGHVKNHSVGMRYVKLVLAVNDEDYGAEYEAWEKYFLMIANKDEAESNGYFWVVKEAKVIEGSAVPLGSNTATPTLDIKEPLKDTQKDEPEQSTHEQLNEIKNIIKNSLK